MTITEKIWREYLECCEYGDGDLVMYREKEPRPGHPRNVHFNWPGSHPFIYCDTPLRIFTADGKTQKGIDFDVWIKGRKSKGGMIRELLGTYMNLCLESESELIAKILKICEVDDV